MKLSSTIFRRWLATFAAVCFLLAAGLTARAVNLVQEFYLPLPEQQLYTTLNTIQAGVSTAQSSIYTIVVTGDGTVIYYDQWEDGYETDLSNPTQSTTQIWGDGNDAHGIPPGFAHNPLGLTNGTVITLTNTVPLPRNPAVILYDARDRIAANKALVVTHAGWPVTPGPVFGGAVSVLSTLDYGTNYISPVGQDMTNVNLLKYVGMSVMAAQNNTTVTIDPNGNGVGVTTNVLNQGESFLINGGIKKGGRVTASKPVQAHLLIGHTGASYASDWFTLYPVDAWDNAYYTPVGSAASGSQPAYVYLFNPSTSAITINYQTSVGSGSFSVPGTNGVYQFQMPIGSGASFVSAGGQNFFAISTVAANNTADTAYNWGFTLVPKGALTTAAQAGWAPGSADYTVNGSPVWVTALAKTTIYAVYNKGTHPFSTNGNSYDASFTVSALQTLKIYDPSPGNNQTALKVFTADGTLITAAWGEDPDKAAPGNPYIDAGTTIIPFPTPTLFKSVTITNDVNPPGLSVGDTLLYTVRVDNKGLLPLGNTVVIDSPTTNLTYVTNSTTYNGTPIPDNPGSYSATNTAFPLDNLGSQGYTIPIILSRGYSTFTYKVLVNAPGSVSNSVNIAGTTIFVATSLAPPPTNGVTLAVNFTDTNGTNVSSYLVGGNVFVTMTNTAGNTSSNTIQTISVTVTDTNTLDLQTITLTETGTNTGVFRNLVGLPTSNSSGLTAQDGTLYVAGGDTLLVSYTDPTYGNSASATATIQVPAPNKQLYLSASGVVSNQFLTRINPVVTAGHGTNFASVDIGSGSVSGTVAVASYSTNGASLTASWTNVIASAPNTLLLVGVSFGKGNGTSLVTNVLYGSTNMTLVASRQSAAQYPVSQIWQLVNPPSGTNKVTVQYSGAPETLYGVAVTFTGVNTNAPLSAVTIATNASSASLTNIVSSTNNAIVFDVFASDANGPTSAGINQHILYMLGDTKEGGAASYQSGASSVTNIWSWTGNRPSVDMAVTIQSSVGSGGGPATNTTSFAQTPVFQLPFTMPSGGTVSITNFITVTNGAANLAGSPRLITATLRTNGVNFLTLTNTTYTAGASNTNLVWTGTLPSAITIPNGVAITYVISNNVANSAFHVNYDSTNSPSQIVLPASTVIAISPGFGAYDAPYSAGGGSLVTTPIAGSTVYIRATVTDPFGYYDITSLKLAVTGPTPAVSFTNTLTDANAVYTNSATKIYEFQWVTSSTTGGYNLAATANEGTEGVTATAATSISTIFLDLGTPSTTEFTAGPNGVGTNNYIAGGVVSVRVTDLNRNTNATTLETITATITNSLGGDWETLFLTETGTNTGIFTNSITVSTNVVGTPTNGVLYAPVGSILTANYTDPTDTSDHTFATATVLPAPGIPGVSMSKTIVSPTGGQTGTNQPVTYNLQVVNTGSTTLTNVVVTDNFPTSRLNYSAATPAPNSNVGGVLTWNTLGNFAPGQSTNITVNFTTTALTGTTTNFATANGGTVTNTTSVNLTVNNAAVNVVKILLSPTNTPVAIGSNVVFRITVQNVGNTTINNLPMEDYFSGAYYQFISSTITNNGSGAGTLIWTNLASPTNLAPNAIITNDVTMKVVGAGAPANNTATVDYATDILGNPVPTSSSTIGVNTVAGSITGHVYLDLDQSGVYNPSDPGLSGVTMDLYTDPNGDGNPVDGALVQVTTTDTSGYYEFLNLNTNHYVIVENHLPGFDSSAPSSNQKPVYLPTLTATNNNNFFDYQPTNASVYSTISGTVWYDANGNGTNDAGETNYIANVSIQLYQDVNTNGLADFGEPLMGSATTDANGNYSLPAVTPGYYVIRQTLPYGYYSTGDSQGRTDSQLVFVSTNGVVSTSNSFFDRLSPTAVNDTNSALYLVPTTINPLTNDISPNGDPLTITNIIPTGGIAVINPGGTNLTFTPTNSGPDTITYTISDGHGGTSSATITVNVTSSADLAIGKSAASAVYATSNLTYTISVTNFGPSGASSVMVTDTLPAGVTFVSATGGGSNSPSTVVWWTLGTLTNNQTTNFTVTITASANGTLTNTASVSSPTPDPNSTNNVTPPVRTGVTPVTDIIVLNAGPTNVLANTTYTNTILVTNAGPSTATNVVVIDTLPDGTTVTNVLPILLAGSGTNYIVTYTAPPSGSLTNVANSTSGTFDPNLVNNTNIVAITVVTPVANVSVTKSGPAGMLYGTNFNYTITVSNAGPSTATSLSVTDSLPTGLFFVSSVPATTTNASNQVIWNLGDFAANVGSNLTLTVVAKQLGSLTNIASGGSPVFDPNPTNNTAPPVVTSVTNIPPTATPDNYAMAENTTNVLSPLTNDIVRTPGGVLSVISVSPTNGTATIIGGTNVSFVPTTNFVGVATIGYTIIDGIGGTNSSLITVTVTNLAPVAFNQSVATTENTALPITLTGSDPAGHTLTFSIVSNALGGTLTGLNTNTGAVTYTPTNNFTGTDTFTFRVYNGYNFSSNATITIAVTPVADLVVAQSGPTSGVAGSNLVFTVAVTNLGPAGATNIVVTNQLDAGYTFVSASAAGGTNGNNQVIWTIPALPANGATNLTVTLFAVEGGTFTNLASGSNSTLDLNVTNNNGSLTNARVVTTVSALADVAVFKTGDTNVLAGGVVHYVITATNAGPSTAQNVVVQDQLPAGTTLQTASGNYFVSNNVVIWAAANLPGGTATNFTLTLLPPVTGTLTNFALSTSPTPDSNTNNNTGTSSNSIVTTVVTPVADLAVGKSGVAAGVINSNFSYTISVTNLGPSTAANLAVTDSLPAGLVFVSAIPTTTTNAANQVIWSNLGTLASNAVTTLTLTVQATARAVFTNIATVGGPTVDPNPTNNTSSPVATSITNRPPVAVDDFASTARNVAVTIPVLANDSDPDGDALTIIFAGGTNGLFSISGTNVIYTPTNAVPGTNVFTYTIIDGFGGTNSALVTVAVTNRPPVATNDVVAGTNYFSLVIFPLANDTDPDGDALTITSAVSTNGIVTINPGNTNLTFIPTNSPVATITYMISDGFGGTSTATITVNVTGSADLAIGKFASPTVYASSNLNYTISVTNLGANTASSVTVTDALPAGVSFVSASGSYVTNNNVVTWSVGSLTNRQITNLTVTVKAPASGTLTNTASVTSPTPDPVTTNNVTPPVTTSVTPVTDIIVLNAGPTNVLANTTYTNTISVTNAGPSTATNVVVIDTLPDGTTVTNVLPILLAGSGTNYIVTYPAPPSGSLTNVANGTSGTFDPTLVNNTNIVAVTTVIPVADLAVGKVATGPFVYGSNFGYTISVTNLGPSTASSVTVTDALPAGLRFVSATTGWKTNGSQVVWTNLGSLAAGATTNLSLTVYAGTNGIVSNTANVGGPTVDPNPTNNSSPPVVTTINPGTLIITANNTNKVYGQTITFANTEFTVSGLVVGDSVSSVTLSSAGAISTAGVSGSPYSIIATNAVGSGLANYNIYYTNGLLTVTSKPLVITAGSTNKVYNTSLNLGTNAFTSVGLVPGETVGGVTLSSSGTVSNAPVGTYPITATNAVGGTFDPNNYSITYSNGLLTVTPAVPVLTWTNPPSIVYGTPLGTNQNDAVANVVGTNYMYNPTNGTILTVGTNTLRVVFTPADTNYITVSNSVQLVVTPAPLVITANSTNKIYNTVLSLGTTAFTSSGLVLNQTIGGVTLSSSCTVASAPVGSYAITATNAMGGTFSPTNYSITYSNGLLTVNPLPVVMYGVRGIDGTTNAAASILQVTNNAGGDVVIVASGVGGIFSSNVGVWPITSFGALALGGASATNYTLVGASGWVSVTNTVPVTNSADIVVSVSGPATVTVGDAFSYTVVVSNAGPTTAVNTRLTNNLSSNLAFVGATGGGVYSNGIATWPVMASLVNGQASNYLVTVKTTAGSSTITPTANPLNFILTNNPPTASAATNRASAFATTFDPNLTNNIASAFYTNAQAQTLIVPGVFSVVLLTNTYPTNAVLTNTITPIGTNFFIVGTSAFNPQTQLYEEFVTVTNIGQAPVHAVRLSIGGLRSGVTLYNATGTNNGVPYVEYDPPYDSPLNPYPQANSSVTFALEFFVADRHPFTNSLTAVAINAPVTAPVNNTNTTSIIISETGFKDTRTVPPRFMVAFTSIPGRTYTVQYSDDFYIGHPTWKNATPSILASATSTFWYDAGPPVTDSPPVYPISMRVYRVLLNP